MPSATPSEPDLDSLLHSLQHALQTDSSSANTSADLSTAKRLLLHSNALIPSTQTPSYVLQTARSILETGALISIHLKDPSAFVRYWSQLQPFYGFAAPGYNPSPDRSKITGLYLLLLLSQGDYAAFHTVLEGLVVAEGVGEGEGEGEGEGAEVGAGMGQGDIDQVGSVVERDPYIRYPVELERSLMEGSYDQVWKRTMGEGVPAAEFALFSQDFIHTIRREIASCAQSSYPSLPVSSAKNLFFLDSDAAVVDFARHNGWSLHDDGRIYFPKVVDDGNGNSGSNGVGGGGASGPMETGAGTGAGGAHKETIQNMVGYARELEMIV